MDLKVSVANLAKWSPQKIDKVDPRDLIFKSKKKTRHNSSISQLKAIEVTLLHYIFKLREQGIIVNTFVVALRASYLSPAFREKSFTAWCRAVKQFTIAHVMTYLMGMHTLQRPPAEVETEALDYMRCMRLIVLGSNRDRHFILNMDQTPVYFSMNAKRMLEVIGKKMIHIRTSTNDTKRVTVAVTIPADGALLPLMLVFKGQSNGRIATREFAMYTATHFYSCQPNAWMDEVVMLAWVNEVLAPYIAAAPDGVVPVLVLDSYRCHMMTSVVQKIQELGEEVMHIPGAGRRCSLIYWLFSGNKNIFPQQRIPRGHNRTGTLIKNQTFFMPFGFLAPLINSLNYY